MKTIETRTRLTSETIEIINQAYNCFENLEQELNKLKATNPQFEGLWDRANTVYGALWDFTQEYKSYIEKNSED